MFSKLNWIIGTWVVGLWLLFSTGCSSAGLFALSDQLPLKEKLLAEYKYPEVNLVLQNGNTLGISFVNSPFNDLSREEKESKAREIATFAKNNYSSVSQIDTIWVAFVVYKKIFFIVDYTNALDTFFFDKRELGSDSDLNKLGHELTTIFVFSDKSSSSTSFFTTFQTIGMIALGFGIIWVVFTIILVVKLKQRALWIVGIIALCPLLFGCLFTFAGGTAASTSNQEYERLSNVYKSQAWKIAEGNVHLVRSQPRGGHAAGDLVIVNGVEFVIDYFNSSWGYHNTVAYGGILKDGTYARIYYEGKTILRIDAKLAD